MNLLAIWCIAARWDDRQHWHLSEGFLQVYATPIGLHEVPLNRECRSVYHILSCPHFSIYALNMSLWIFYIDRKFVFKETNLSFKFTLPTNWGFVFLSSKNSKGSRSRTFPSESRIVSRPSLIVSMVQFDVNLLIRYLRPLKYI